MSNPTPDEPVLDLADPAQGDVYFVTAPDLDVLHAGAVDAGIEVHRIALEQCTGKATLLDAIADALQFPDGHGRNWDALTDALRDLDWLGPPRARALLFSDAGTLLDADQASFDTLVEILEEACASWREDGIALWAFLALPEIEFEAEGEDLPRPAPLLH